MSKRADGETQRIKMLLEAASQLARHAPLPEGYLYGEDAMEAFYVGRDCAAAAILALARDAGV